MQVAFLQILSCTAHQYSTCCKPDADATAAAIAPPYRRWRCHAAPATATAARAGASTSDSEMIPDALHALH